MYLAVTKRMPNMEWVTQTRSVSSSLRKMSRGKGSSLDSCSRTWRCLASSFLLIIFSLWLFASFVQYGFGYDWRYICDLCGGKQGKPKIVLFSRFCLSMCQRILSPGSYFFGHCLLQETLAVCLFQPFSWSRQARMGSGWMLGVSIHSFATVDKAKEPCDPRFQVWLKPKLVCFGDFDLCCQSLQI